jgi:dolichol-phosphate mannosyltransferase
LTKRFLLAIPVYNEERYLPQVLAQARKRLSTILVIDDGSTDATENLLRREQNISVIRHPENRGYGASLASAFSFAIREGYDWLITMDCDEQHEPAFLPRFIEAAESDDHDIISGSRYLSEFNDQDIPPADRRAINHRVTGILNNRLDLGVTDAFCGFKAYRVCSLRQLAITVPGYAMPMQFWVQAWRAGLRITEIPVRLIYNDPTRHFGGMLDDPTSRFQHYMAVFESEMNAASSTRHENCCLTGGDRSNCAVGS